MKRISILVLAALLMLSVLSSCSRIPQNNTASRVVLETVRVTFPEGWNVVQYGQRLEESKVCTAQEFYDAMNNIDYSVDYPFLPAEEILAQREYRLEGYLYPDTYEFYLNTDGEKVVRKMLDCFKMKVADELYETPSYSGLSFDECITLAAIVEKETPVVEERPKIAAVFINRLNNKAEYPKLESDTTFYYPYLKATKPEEFVSEYDTRYVKGLPKGAICNPDRTAIESVIHHDAEFTGYYFFIVDNYKNHYYSKTYKEHKKYIRYCKENGLY